MIRDRVNYEVIIQYVDDVVFKDLVSKEEVQSIKEIRRRYMKRRLND